MSRKPVRWQFRLWQLLLTVAVVPVLAGVASGTFGEAPRAAFWRFLELVVICGLFWLPTAVLGIVVWMMSHDWRRTSAKRHKTRRVDLSFLK